MSDLGAGAAAGAGIGGIFGPVGAGVGAGVGALGGGIIDWMQTDETNNRNEVMQMRSQQFNHAEAQNARDWSERMSGTAHQREMADLKAAGLNPDLAANAGASTPGATSASVGPGNAMQKSNLGSFISQALPSAMAAAKTVADIENTGKDSLLKDAQTLSQAALAHQTNVSAAKAGEELRQLESQRDAVGAESKARQNRAALDLQNEARERVIKQLFLGSGAANNAMGAANGFKDLLNPLRMLFGGKATTNNSGTREYTGPQNLNTKPWDGDLSGISILK